MITDDQMKVINAVLAERRFQDKKYGPVLLSPLEDYYKNGGLGPKQGPGGHDLAAWLIILELELNEAKLAVAHGGSQKARGRDSIRHEILQIAAVAMAALEQHGMEETS